MAVAVHGAVLKTLTEKSGAVYVLAQANVTAPDET